MGPRNKKRKRVTREASPPLQRLSTRISLSPEESTDVPIVSQTQESVVDESVVEGIQSEIPSSPTEPSVASPSVIARATIQSPVKVDNEAIKAMVNGGDNTRPQQLNLDLVKRPSYAGLTATSVLSFLRDPLIDAPSSVTTASATSDTSMHLDEATIARECQNFFGIHRLIAQRMYFV